MNVQENMQTSNVHHGGSISSSIVQKNPMGIKPTIKFKLSWTKCAMQAQMQGLMACNNQRAAQQGSYANRQQKSFNASAYNPYVPSQLNSYGAPYYNPGVFNGEFANSAGLRLSTYGYCYPILARLRCKSTCEARS